MIFNINKEKELIYNDFNNPLYIYEKLEQKDNIFIKKEKNVKRNFLKDFLL